MATPPSTAQLRGRRENRRNFSTPCLDRYRRASVRQYARCGEEPTELLFIQALAVEFVEQIMVEAGNVENHEDMKAVHQFRQLVIVDRNKAGRRQIAQFYMNQLQRNVASRNMSNRIHVAIDWSPPSKTAANPRRFPFAARPLHKFVHGLYGFHLLLQ